MKRSQDTENYSKRFPWDDLEDQNQPEESKAIREEPLSNTKLIKGVNYYAQTRDFDIIVRIKSGLRKGPIFGINSA